MPYSKKIFAILYGTFLGTMLHAQVQVMPKTKIIFPGQPLSVDITISSREATIPRLTDSLGIFDILQKDSATQKRTDTGFVVTQHLIITGYEAGRWLLPAVAAEDARVAASKPDSIVVMALPADSLRAYTDIRTYLPASSKPIYKNALFITALLATGAFLFFLLRRKRIQKIPTDKSIVTLASWHQQWKRLLQQHHAGQLTHTEAAAFQLALIRSLFALRGTPPGSYTGSELVKLAQPTWPTTEWQALQQVVSMVYSILFAGQQPPPAQVLASIHKLGEMGQKMLPPKNQSAPDL